LQRQKKDFEGDRIINSRRESDLISGVDFSPEAASEKIISIFSSGDHH
jgi:hypothetical protein